MKKPYYLTLQTEKNYKILNIKARRNICRQIHCELDNTGNFYLKQVVTTKNMLSTLIVVPFKNRNAALSFRDELKAGMHPNRYRMLKIHGRLECNIPSSKMENIVKVKARK